MRSAEVVMLVSPEVSGGAGRTVEDASAEKACRQFDQNAGALAAVVEEWIKFDQIERRHQAAVREHLHHQMRFAECRAAGDGGAHARRELRVEEIDIETDM